MLNIVRLTADFHETNPNLSEALHDKGRGYGIVKIKIKNNIFGIPLRTNLNHRNGVVLDTVKKDGKTYKRGLDYTKAVLIRDETKELGPHFVVPGNQKKVLISKKKSIHNQFERYVDGYIFAVKENKTNTLSSVSYRYTTLVNYHSELGI